MTHEEKNVFIQNIFKLIIGTILLSTCFLYLGKNSAERIALYSSYQLIIQKAEVVFHNIVWQNGDLLDQKYNLQKQYLELIHLAEEKGCSDAKFLEELYSTYQNLLSEDKNTIENYIGRYRILGIDFQNKLEGDNCTR